MKRRFGRLYEDGKPARDLSFDEAVERYLHSITSTLEDDINRHKQASAAADAVDACRWIEIAGKRI